MQIHNKANLKTFHTFAVDVTCEVVVVVNTFEELLSVYTKPEWRHLPKLLLGRGSNVLFIEHFAGVVIVNSICGIKVTETKKAWHLHVNCGEDWPKLVEWSLENGYFGLENLALIPGCAGSAPIQNIGAYGVEFTDVCDYVDVLNIESLKVSRLNDAECNFDYRDSIFKKELKNKVVIIAVGIKLPKCWEPIINYGSLKTIPTNELTADRVFEEVCKTRNQKLPDPKIAGNAGSFFKNPIITVEQARTLEKEFPDLVVYPVENGYKVAAGWLIDECGLKGTTIGGAMVHQDQALVIVNYNNATPQHIVKLAAKVRKTVFNKYGILLEHEVRFFNSKEETTLDKLVDI